jgi:predicted nucleic acid-binding Zn ribbon protein
MQYEYSCRVCNGVKIIERSIHAEEDIPLCCGELSSKVFYAAPVKFNTGGFYSTDK